MKNLLFLVAALGGGRVHAQFAVAPSTSDALDSAQGTLVTNFTAGIGPAPTAAIGANPGGPEPGTCFCPNVGVGNYSFVEVLTASAVTLSSARLYGKNDGAANAYRRAMSGFRLMADTDANGTFETTVVNATIATNYALQAPNLALTTEYLELLFTFAPTSAAAWRMEFVQGTSVGIYEGARVIEVDGIAAPCPLPVAYCTSGTTSGGCTATISGAGTASVTATSGFTIAVNGAESQKQGIVFYGVNNSGFTPTAWGGGASYLCVKAPTQRLGVQNTGGTAGVCDGLLSIDWNAFRAANPTALGSPFSAGQQIYAQGWFRDPPAPKTTSLSNALMFALCP